MILFPNGIQGLADSKWQGVRGSVSKIVGVDYRSTPGLIKVHQRLIKASGEVVDELCKVSLPLSDGSTLWFSSESGIVWREVDGTFTLVTELELPGYSFKLSTAEDASQSKDISAEVNIPTGICFKPDGLTMYVMGDGPTNFGEIFQYTLTTAFDISTATYSTKTYAADVQGRGLSISSDGTKVYISEDGGSTSVITYDLGTPWDISTASPAGETFDFSAQMAGADVLNFKSDGTKMILFDFTGQEANVYDLGTPWDVTTATFANTFSFGAALTGACISPDGYRVYRQESIFTARITEYILSTAWDISTAVASGDTFSAGSGRYFALTALPDASGFVTGTQSGSTIYKYTVTNVAEDLNVTILGAAEHSVPAEDAEEDDEPTPYVYFATKNQLLRIATADVDLDWNGTLNAPVYEYLTTFRYGDDTYHPFQKQNGRLYIGDKYVIAEVNEAGVITRETPFNVAKTERITAIVDFDVDVLVATKETNIAWVKRWDTESDSWYAQDWIPEKEITAFLKDDNYVYAISIDFGRMYYYDGEQLVPYKRIPGEYSSSAKVKVNPNAVGFFMNSPVFGLSSKTGNPAFQGVYGFGRYSKDYNVTLSFDFPLSCERFDDIEIGSILVDGDTMMVSWKRDGECGVDIIDWANKYPNAFIETGLIVGGEDRSKFKSMKQVHADYYLLPASTGIEFSVSKNYGGFTDIDDKQVVDEKLQQIRTLATQPELGSVEILIEFDTNGNDCPEIENFHALFDGENVIPPA